MADTDQRAAMQAQLSAAEQRCTELEVGPLCVAVYI